MDGPVKEDVGKVGKIIAVKTRHAKLAVKGLNMRERYTKTATTINEKKEEERPIDYRYLRLMDPKYK